MLYQHVLAACLVARHAIAPFYERLVVEKDEDIEVACTGTRHYLQVKAVEGLVFSHLYGMLLRMHDARRRHLAGERAGDCKLYLVSGGTLGPELAQQRLDAIVLEKVRTLAREGALDEAALVETWRAIEFVTPGSQLPALASTRVLAGVVPQLAYLVEIVLKVTRLASAPVASAYALVTSMYAIAADSLGGFTARIVQASDTPRLIEVVRRQVEPLPELPVHFVPLPLGASTFVPGQHCVLLGDSGTGKSSQLSYIASSRTTPTVYLRPVGALSDEIVDQLRSALEALGVDLAHLGSSTAAVPAHETAAQLVRALPATTLVFVDDVHLLSESPAVRELLRHAVRRRDLCLAVVGQAARPDGSPTSSWIQTFVGAPLRSKDVPGWGFTETSSYLHLEGIAADPVLAEHVRRLCGGSPIAVVALVALCIERFGGDMERTLVDLARTGTDPSVHGIVTRRFQRLPRAARRVAATMAVTEWPNATAADLEPLLEPGEARAGFEHLREQRILTRVAGDRLELPETYAAVAASLAGDDFADIEALHAEAADTLERRFRATNSLGLAIPTLRNRALAGDISGAVQAVTGGGGGELWAERLQRRGIGTPLARLIDSLLLPRASGEDKFWLLDVLVFLNINEDLRRDIQELWRDYQSAFASLEDPSRTAEISFALKSMHYHAKTKDVAAIDTAWRQAQGRVESPMEAGIVANMYATALWQSGEFDQAWIFARRAVDAASMVLQLDFRLLWSQDDPSSALRDSDADDVARLADNIELLGQILESQRDNPIPMYLRAASLFQLVGADKAKMKAWYLMQLNCARDPAQRAAVHRDLAGLLDEIRRSRAASQLLDVTAALIALDRIMDRGDEADELLQSLDDRAALVEKVEWASGIMKTPLRSDRVAAFIEHLFTKPERLRPNQAKGTRKPTATRSVTKPKPARTELAKPKTTKSTKTTPAKPSLGTPKPAKPRRGRTR